MNFKKILLVSAMMSAFGASSCFANELIDQTINNAVAAQQPNSFPAAGVPSRGAPQPTFPSQQGIGIQQQSTHQGIPVAQMPQGMPTGQAPTSEDRKSSAVISVLADKVNPFTGEPMTVEDRKNMLSAVSLDAQILDKQLEVAKKEGELKILPERVKNQLLVEQGGSVGQGGQSGINEQLLLQQQQNTEAEIERRVQEGVRKAELAKNYEIQTLQNQLKKKKSADAKMTLSYLGNAAGQKTAVIRVGDDDKKVKEGGVVAGWVVSQIDLDGQRVMLNKRGRFVSLDMKRGVSQIASSSKSSGSASGSYEGGDEPITPNLPNALPLPRL